MLKRFLPGRKASNARDARRCEAHSATEWQTVTLQDTPRGLARQTRAHASQALALAYGQTCTARGIPCFVISPDRVDNHTSA